MLLGLVLGCDLVECQTGYIVTSTVCLPAE